MHQHVVVWALASSLVVSGCSASRRVTSNGPPALAASPSMQPASSASMIATTERAPADHPSSEAATTTPGTAPAASSPFAFAALGEPNADTHATRGLSGGTPRTAMAPNMTAIPSPSARPSVPPNAGADQTLKSLPEGIPVGHLSRDVLEGPLRDPLRFARCRKNTGTRIEIDAVIYNGAALGVTVRTTPSDRALNFCVERIVRDTSWIKELAVNRVSITL